MTEAVFFDGKSAVRKAVRVACGAEALAIEAEGLAHSWPYGDILILEKGPKASWISVGCRAVPNARLHLDDAATVGVLLALLPKSARAPRGMGLGSEAKLVGGLVAFAATLGCVVWLAPQWLAPLVPKSVGRKIDRSMLPAMALQKECHSRDGDMVLQTLAWKLWDKERPMPRITVVKGNAVNAFATPGDQIFILEPLLKAAKSEEEVAGVLAHEMGHVRHHHPMGQMIRVIGLGALAESAGSRSMDAATVVAAISFTRDAEEEADRDAIQRLKAARIDVRPFAAFFDRLAKSENGKVGGTIPHFLSTHPASVERAELARDAAKAQGKPRKLYAERWDALQHICDSKAEPMHLR